MDSGTLKQTWYECLLDDQLPPLDSFLALIPSQPIESEEQVQIPIDTLLSFSKSSSSPSSMALAGVVCYLSAPGYNQGCLPQERLLSFLLRRCFLLDESAISPSDGLPLHAPQVSEYFLLSRSILAGL